MTKKSLFTLFKTLISQKLSHQLSSNKLSVIIIITSYTWYLFERPNVFLFGPNYGFFGELVIHSRNLVKSRETSFEIWYYRQKQGNGGIFVQGVPINMEDIFRMKLSFGRSLRMEVDSTGLHRLNVKLNFALKKK